MELMHNGVIRLDAPEPLRGIFRVVAVAKARDLCALARIADLASSDNHRHGGRRLKPTTKRPRRKPPLPLIGDLIWRSVAQVEQLHTQGRLLQVDLLNDHHYYGLCDPEPDRAQKPRRPLEKDGEDDEPAQYQGEDHKKRCLAMKDFLDPQKLQAGLLKTRSLAPMVEDASAASGLARPTIYKYFSLLCRFGFDESSLILRRFNCGARGISRPCDPGGRKKAGRWTKNQRLHFHLTGKALPPDQPGFSTDWQVRVLAADSQISTPKPTYPTRAQLIIDSAFVTQYQEVQGVLIPIAPAKGTYPTRRQIARFLERHIDKLTKVAEHTTEGHMARAKRGLKGRSWKGVPGPGHTYAIDSTIGDVYLRSTVNRAWLVGRPIVYVLVDVWSTAIVGFHVCLCGPSWDMAKLAIFSTAAPPSLMGELWHYVPIVSLHPAPTLPYYLLCDRGEYLSRGAKLSGMVLKLNLQYTPPYRPDLKGIVEVLHRIAKDKIYFFIPGAIDARRAEYELRRFNPKEGVLTVPEFVAYLHVVFSLYNLNADRSKRLDTAMRAAGVRPSPAGLWSYGHVIGAGVQRATTLPRLISSLLPAHTASVNRDGVSFAGLEYSSQETEAEQWTAYARNYGSHPIPIHNFPGSVSRIWTPNTSGKGMLDLTLSDYTRATRFQTLDDVTDAFEYGTLNISDEEHRRTVLNNQLGQISKFIISQAEQLTREVLSIPQDIPTITEARQIESQKLKAPPAEVRGNAPRISDSELMHRDMMKNILERMSHASVTGRH